MDATPDKFYYVGLPRLPRLRMSDRPRFPHLPVPTLPFAAALVRCRRNWGRSSKATGTWWAAHTLEVAVWTLGTAVAVGVGMVVAGL
jgi:hypothetical protein